MQAKLQEEYRSRIIPVLLERYSYRNAHQVPRIEKVVINTCVASASSIKEALEVAQADLGLITGQKPIVTLSKKNVSNFKLRKHQEIGSKVTLRGRIMYEFLERFIFAALPRIRDFRGVSAKAFDGHGNYTIGISDQSIFPEVELDKVKYTIGFDITIVTTASTNEEAKSLLAEVGMPFSDKK